jgi:8-oxo-dGTP pyrophosphatase MutT (NUDIX family)
MDLAAIRALLANRTAVRLALAGSRRAAVLVPFISAESGVLEVLFTRRTADLGSHPGQISFPGGSIDEADADEVAAALRETEEELGIATNEIEVLGELDGVVTSGSKFQITPIAGHLRGRPKMKPNAREVAEVLFVPFEVFESESTMEIADIPERKGVITYRYGEVAIWGATARIMHQLVRALRGERKT